MTDAKRRADRLVSSLNDYRATISPHYDEVLEAVAATAQERGDIGKVEIGALVTWKRLRASTPWAGELMGTADEVVCATTRRARDAVRAHERDAVESAATAARIELSTLPGFVRGDALASAVICALAPDRMAVYDKRAHRALAMLGLELTDRPGRYGRYMKLVQQLIHEAELLGKQLTARDVDVALYQLGG